MMDQYPYTWQALRARYNMKRKRLDRIMADPLLVDKAGKPQSLLDRLRHIGLRTGQRYFTNRQWGVATSILDDLLLEEDGKGEQGNGSIRDQDRKPAY